MIEEVPVREGKAQGSVALILSGDNEIEIIMSVLVSAAIVLDMVTAVANLVAVAAIAITIVALPISKYNWLDVVAAVVVVVAKVVATVARILVIVLVGAAIMVEFFFIDFILF